MRWLIGTAIVVAAAVVAAAASKLVRRVLSKRQSGNRAASLADPASTIVFSLVLGGGLMAGLGYASPENVRDLPRTIIDFVPRALVALIVVLIGSAVGTLAANLVGEAVVRGTGRPQPVVARATRILIVVLSVVFGVSQLGIDTRILDLLVAAAVWCSIGTIAALTVLGGREVSAEVASGRYVKRIVAIGDRVTVHDVTGEVTAVHGATVELRVDDTDARVHLAHRHVLAGPIRIERPQSDTTR
jgi:hypothetical protein